MFKVDKHFRAGNELTPSEFIPLQQGIIEFQKKLGFDAASSTDVTLMLRRIEGEMEKAIKKLALCNQQDVMKLASKREKERRDDERTRNQELNKLKQQEKAKKALDKANMPIKRRTGRPLNKRTIPVKGEGRESKEEKDRRMKLQEEADQELYYGLIWD
jgi:hypothetical protein